MIRNEIKALTVDDRHTGTTLLLSGEGQLREIRHDSPMRPSQYLHDR